MTDEYIDSQAARLVTNMSSDEKGEMQMQVSGVENIMQYRVDQDPIQYSFFFIARVGITRKADIERWAEEGAA